MKSPIFLRRSRKWIFAWVGLGAIAIFLFHGYSAENYLDPNTPFYFGQYAAETPKLPKSLTFVSYNIWFAEEIDQALVELEEFQGQREIDILLLQEMDEAGVEQIARELHLNYVYYPAAVEPTYGKNFGNAVLSRWPIAGSQKLILPHKSLSNRMSRTATRATLQVYETEIFVYSLHTESIFTLPQFREDQFAAVLQDIPPQAQYVIVGGDFNSFTQAEVTNIEQHYREAGFTRASLEAGNTVVKYGVGVPADHIFTKGFRVEEAGTILDAVASDHLPVWVTVVLP